jgi:hypothetical protein
MKAQEANMAAGVLTITAAILLVGIVLLYSGGQNQALASGQLDRGGDYVVVTGQYTLNTELIYVTDAAAGRMNVYSFERTQEQLRLWDSHDFKREFAEGKP